MSGLPQNSWVESGTTGSASFPKPVPGASPLIGASDIPWPYSMWGYGIRPPEYWLVIEQTSAVQC